MAKHAIVKSGGKQYIVKENDVLVVDRLPLESNTQTELETLAVFDPEGASLDLGTPALKSMVKATVVEHFKGDKIRVAKFKAKVRYRKVRGFRHALTKLQIVSI